jgi:glutathione S-transferase
MAMIRIWGRQSSANVQKVLWCLRELGLEFDRIDVGGPFGGLDKPEYRALNPNGLIPTIEDGTVSVWESNTIVRYLSAKYGAGSLYPEGPEARAAADRWMDWHLCHFLPSVATVFFGLVRTPPKHRDLAAIEAARRQTGDILGILDRHLAKCAYVGGSEFTMGDIALGGWAHRWFAMDIKRPVHPDLERWYERLREREPYQSQILNVGL